MAKPPGFDLGQTLQQAVALHQQGRLDEARGVLDGWRAHADSLALVLPFGAPEDDVLAVIDAATA